MDKEPKFNDKDLARQVWRRYLYMRDNGHTDYVKMAELCENSVFNEQWEKADKDRLSDVGRPALTINKILPTVSNVQGTQIFNRTDTAFKPRNNGATQEVADALTKVFMQVGDNNQLVWVRSDVFKDGLYTGRGFYDARMSYEDSLRGEVAIRQLNPKNVMIDPDADTYNPEGWADVMYTEWQSLNDIALIYGKSVADKIETQGMNVVDGAVDEMGLYRDKFGDDWAYTNNYVPSDETVSRNNRRMVRVADYQWRQLTKRNFFVDMKAGDLRAIPTGWEDERVQEYIARNQNVEVIERVAKRIRWTVVAGDEVLHDEWSPYEYMTIIPYFPHFTRGRTMGLVEPLLGSQELLNKTSSQELHVVNTTANSGYYVKRNALQNMSVADLEANGAKTGLVIELDELGSIMKIPPNPTPTGLDRISYKAEEHIKTISGVSDYMTGNAREDVSAKSVKANQAGGAANTATIQDNLNRTDYIMTNVVLSMIQSYYTEERLVTITTDRLQNTTEELVVNQMTPEGTIANDLTLGEYSVVITNQPDRDTFEETQYDQALSMRTEAGIQIPDRFIIQSSKLKDKAEIIKALEGDQDSPEAQAEAARQERLKEAEVADKEADVALKTAKAQAEMAKVQGAGQPEGMDANQMMELQLKEKDLQLEKYKIDKELEFKRFELEKEMEMRKYEADLKHSTSITVADKGIQAKEDVERAKVDQEEEDADNDAFMAALDSVEDEPTEETPTPPTEVTPNENV